jgi:hypothetical protein
MNIAASTLGKLAKGKPKTMSPAALRQRKLASKSKSSKKKTP